VALLEEREDCGARDFFSERIKKKDEEPLFSLAEAGRRMASRVGRLPAGSRRYGNTARKRFARGRGAA